MKKTKILNKKPSKTPVWDLGLLYKHENDPHIERDMRDIEERCENFALKYTKDTTYLIDSSLLFTALTDYETLLAYLECKPILYFFYLKDVDAKNKIAQSMIPLLSSRHSKAVNKIIFFEINLGKISLDMQESFLNDDTLKHFKVFLQRIFDAARFNLSEAEEKIMNLKSLPSHEMWIDANDKMLNTRSVKWQGKNIPLSEATQKVHEILNPKTRHKLHKLISAQYSENAPMAEAEINAVYTNKKINDELRGYKKAYENTVNNYQNDMNVVEGLIKTVTEAFPLVHKFYRLKSKIIKLKKLSYSDRAVSIGSISQKFSFGEARDVFIKVLSGIDKKYVDIFESYLRNGQIDVLPRMGKTSGAYCSSTILNPTFVLLNHTESFNSFSVLAHEMGHAFHSELSAKQGPIYSHYSTSLAESASTLFETIAVDHVSQNLSDKEKIIALHDSITDDIQTIFRQIACFNFEKDLHDAIRTKGYLVKEEIANLHNKHMKAYLGPLFNFQTEDGYFFTGWSHIRRFFYVYTYAYGQLVSKALIRRYRNDKSFWSKIEQYLSAGGKDSPENILKEIGLDVSTPEFWKEGIREVEEKISKLERLIKK